MTDLKGQAEEGWGPVAEAFRENFELHEELGAAFCVYADGRPVVDLWAGIADLDGGRPWAEDTVLVGF